MKPCDTGYCDIDRCSDEQCKEGMEAITEVTVAPIRGHVDPEKEKVVYISREEPAPETLKKCYEIGAHYRKVTVYYSDWSGQMDHVDTFRPEKGLNPSDRKKAVNAELERRGFDV